jgi:GntR family transcriptional repressor for pyruvate dehydrogenase complex
MLRFDGILLCSSSTAGSGDTMAPECQQAEAPPTQAKIPHLLVYLDLGVSFRKGIVDQIRTLIEKGKLKHGDQLPTESELSDTFKVSRSTVREAILLLETMMFVERRQGDGTYVIASSEEALIQPLAAFLFHEKDDLADIFRVRQILETEIADLAAMNATPKMIGRLEEILEKQASLIEDGKNPLVTDSDFHYALAKMSNNKVLERLLVALVGFLGKTREAYLQTSERMQKSLEGHRIVLEAIKSGDGTAARQAMKRHLATVESVTFPKKARGRARPQ